jgi:hypothetical protein
VIKTKSPEYYQASQKEHLFKTKICQTKNSKAAIGVYGGTDKEGRDLVLSGGVGYIFVANKGQNIEIGDYLVSSDILGCAEKQSDDICHNNTVAKITQNVIWEDGEEKRLVKCIYLSG